MEVSSIRDRAHHQDYRPQPGTLDSGGWFWVENEAAEWIGQELGVHALAVFTVLARRANSTTRQC